MILDKKSKEAIVRLNNFAEKNKISLDDVKRMSIKEADAIGDNLDYVCYLTCGYRIVFSIEEQPAGLYRHISISGNAKLPEEDIETIMHEFGITGKLHDNHVWIEEDLDIIGKDNPITAVNILQAK